MLLLSFAIGSYSFFGSDTICSVKSNLNIIKAYLQAKQKCMQQGATKADVEKLVSFYSDTLNYEHVLPSGKKFVFHGTDDLRNGYISHLGETRNVKISLLNYIERQNILVAEYSSRREIISSGKNEEYKTVSLYEFDESGKIKYVIDYL